MKSANIIDLNSVIKNLDISHSDIYKQPLSVVRIANIDEIEGYYSDTRQRTERLIVDDEFVGKSWFNILWFSEAIENYHYEQQGKKLVKRNI